MKLFFVKMKPWQLVLLLGLIYLIPLSIGFNWIYTNDETTDSDLGIRSIVFFFRGLGIMAILVSAFLFLWKWSLGHYLYELLPDKEEVNFKRFKLSLLIKFIFGLVWGLLFLTGYIFVILFATGDTPYLVFLLIILYAITVFVFAKAHLFPYLASKAIKQELPYRAITLSPFNLGFLRMIELQKDVNEVYLKLDNSKK